MKYYAIVTRYKINISKVLLMFEDQMAVYLDTVAINRKIFLFKIKKKSQFTLFA